MKATITAVFGAAVLLASGNVASQSYQNVPLYDYRYYSDATYTEEAGFQGGRCYGQYPSYAGVEQYVHGTATSFVVAEEVGYCTPAGETVYM